MDKEEIMVAVLRIEGTNCEDETAMAFESLGVKAEIVHLKQFYSDMIRFEEQRSVFDYHCIVFPGGFSAGDYVRAGAIFSARVKSVLRKDLEEFIKAGYPILGICNGFQILAELGALPGFDEDKPISDKPEMALAINDSGRFECRHTLLKVESKKCVFTKNVGKEILRIPVAH
ncbi:MAG: phosphoribosylformylglycinamidine synthase subunit PurQ, partial [Archaeoglobaceae archaeon]